MTASMNRSSTEADLLHWLGESVRESGPDTWTLFGPCEDDVLSALHKREPGLLKLQVTKRDGMMWRLARP